VSGPGTQELLARQRTRLANERTLLAYVRTFLGFLGLGVALIAIFDVPLVIPLGLAAMGSGVLLLGVGLASFLRNRRAYGASESTGQAGEDGP
jgi:putative membrane protein